MFELIDVENQVAIIKVIGVGGGGGNAVQHMLNGNIDGVDFICANTDSQALKNLTSKTILQLGSNITKGLGAGSDPEIGRQAALEDRDRIMDVLDGSDMIFITAGMGGGTGTGATPVVAQVAKEMGILTVAVVTRPFSFEGKKRAQVADEGIDEVLGVHREALHAVHRALRIDDRSLRLDPRIDEGGDDELDIDPGPGSTNAKIDLDLTWDGGIQLNGEGLGWYGQPTTLHAGPNWISFTITVQPDGS